MVRVLSTGRVVCYYLTATAFKERKNWVIPEVPVTLKLLLDRGHQQRPRLQEQDKAQGDASLMGYLPSSQPQAGFKGTKTQAQNFAKPHEIVVYP